MFIIAANWKMNGEQEFARNYNVALKEFIASSTAQLPEIIILPPSPLLYLMKGNYKLGAQNCHAKDKGAFTGEISAGILKDVGCQYVLLGHSERREMGEKCILVSEKAAAAHAAGLKTIICVGEKEGEDFDSVVFEQLKNSIPSCADENNTVIAYEPVWAIGTGRTPTAEDIGKCHSKIKAKYNFSLLYGGSVKAANAGEISKISNVDGLLVGGASLDVDEFKTLITACNHE